MTEMIVEEQTLQLEEEVPQWLRSDVLDGEAREQAMDMMRRLTVHLRDKTTDQADSTMEEPIDNYLDPEVFKAEVDLIFKRIPLPLALSAELPHKNSYKAIEAVGRPGRHDPRRQGRGARDAQRVPSPRRPHLRGARPGAGAHLPVPRVVVQHGRRRAQGRVRRVDVRRDRQERRAGSSSCRAWSGTAWSSSA